MFLVRNNNKEIYIIPEISFTFRPYQVANLDLVATRVDIIGSTTLRSLINEKKLVVEKVKDEVDIFNQTIAPIVETEETKEDAKMNDMMDKMQAMMDMMGGQKAPEVKVVEIEKAVEKQSLSMSSDDLEAIANRVASKIPTQIISGGNNNQESDDIKAEVNEEAMAKLHANVMDKKLKDTTEAKVNYKTEEVSGSFLDDDLDDLL